MNGFIFMSQQYKGFAKRETDEQKKQEYERLSCMYDMLASVTSQDLFRMIDSGAFNQIIKGYALLAADYISQSRDHTKAEAKELAEAMRFLFENVNAEDAARAYK